ncbi:MAG: dihydrolipoamide acetyltransferase [Anaeromyxobacter sp.]
MVRYVLMAALCWVVQPELALAQASEAPAAPAAATPAQAPDDASTAAAAPAARPPMTADEKNDLEVRALEQQVADLKEKIYRTKARLMGLQEMVIGGDITTGAKAVLVHRNEMGSSFYLESVAYALDGAPIFTKSDQDGDLEKKEELEIFNGRVSPGNHQISVQLVYRGHGFGLFSYLEGYRFKVQSSYTFAAEPGKRTAIKVVGYEKGGLTAELKDRPAVRYDVDVAREGPPVAPAAAEGAAR